MGGRRGRRRPSDVAAAADADGPSDAAVDVDVDADADGLIGRAAGVVHADADGASRLRRVEAKAEPASQRKPLVRALKGFVLGGEAAEPSPGGRAVDGGADDDLKGIYVRAAGENDQDGHKSAG